MSDGAPAEDAERQLEVSERPVLPEGWTQHRLGEIASFKNGLNFTRSDCGEAIKIVGVSDFKDRSQLDDTGGLATIRVSEMVRDGELLEAGDLLFVRSNGNRELIGRCLYFPRVEERLAFSGFTIRGRFDRALIDRRQWHQHQQSESGDPCGGFGADSRSDRAGFHRTSSRDLGRGHLRASSALG
ncbi:MAG: hypothetical protein MUF16_29850 [Burkholderiaceae bacterium]|nr:hypothetical protein [Burkholderiaceae bacterium]